jgi:hypothetical protein
MISAPAVLILGGNAFGIRRRQGRTYVSAFEATQAYGTAQLAGLRVLVRTACVLAALIAVGVSAWTSSSLMNAWVPWVMDGKEVSQEVLRLRREMGEIFWGLTGYEHATLAVITSIAVAVMVASLAAFRALQARYDRRVLAAGSLLLLYGLALALLALAARNGIASPFLVDALLAATSWIASAAMVFTTVYLLWSGFAGRALTIRYACGAIVISAAFGAAWLTVLHAAGMQLAGMPATNAVSILSPVLVPLMVSVLAPWSLNRIRHI